MLCLLTGLPGSGGWRRKYPPCYLGECVNDATAGENNHEDAKAYLSEYLSSPICF